MHFFVETAKDTARHTIVVCLDTPPPSLHWVHSCLNQTHNSFRLAEVALNLNSKLVFSLNPIDNLFIIRMNVDFAYFEGISLDVSILNSAGPICILLYLFSSFHVCTQSNSACRIPSSIKCKVQWGIWCPLSRLYIWTFHLPKKNEECFKISKCHISLFFHRF